MTINRKLAHRIEWKCDQCGNVGIWDKNWWQFSSLALEDSYPDDIPTLCSDDCMEKFKKRIELGEVVVTEVKWSGYNDVKIIKKRKGY